MDDVTARKAQIWDSKWELPGIDLNIDEQEKRIPSLIQANKTIPFPEHQQENYRYYFNNNAYPHADGLVLFMFLMELKPRKIMEVGSGFSSALILDTIDEFLKSAVQLYFIEPFPGRLHSLLKESDRQTTTIVEDIVQNVDIDLFRQLDANDILLIDNSHVSKTGSDVNFVMTKVLPVLKKGVIVHIHDIFFPFEYPQDWIFEHKLNWNEIYAVHNFLLFNNTYKILFFSDFIHQQHRERLKNEAPLFYRGRPGSLWLQKVE